MVNEVSTLRLGQPMTDFFPSPKAQEEAAKNYANNCVTEHSRAIA